MGHKEALEDLSSRFLARLDQAGVVDLRTILQDGAKIKAAAGSGSFHRRKTLDRAGMEALWVALAYNISQWIRVGGEVAAPA